MHFSRPHRKGEGVLISVQYRARERMLPITLIFLCDPSWHEASAISFGTSEKANEEQLEMFAYQATGASVVAGKNHC